MRALSEAAARVAARLVDVPGVRKEGVDGDIDGGGWVVAHALAVARGWIRVGDDVRARTRDLCGRT